MHTVVIREELVRQHPGLPRSLYAAFVEAKRLAYERLHFTAALSVSLPWLMAEETLAPTSRGAPRSAGQGANCRAVSSTSRSQRCRSASGRKLAVKAFCASRWMSSCPRSRARCTARRLAVR